MFNYKLKINDPVDIINIIRNGTYYYEPNSGSIQSGLTTLKKNKGHCLEWSLTSALLLEHLNFPIEILAMVYNIGDKKIFPKDKLKNGIHFINPYQTSDGFFAIGKSRSEFLCERVTPFPDMDSLIESYKVGFNKEGFSFVHSFLIIKDDLQDYDWKYSEFDLGKLGLTDHLKHLQRENYRSFLKENLRINF